MAPIFGFRFIKAIPVARIHSNPNLEAAAEADFYGSRLLAYVFGVKNFPQIQNSIFSDFGHFESDITDSVKKL